MLRCILSIYVFFFFSSRRRHTRCSRDWSSDVCSSDLYGEYGFEVPPLRLPSYDSSSQLAELRHCPSVALFLQRAAAVKPDFELIKENRSEERRVGKECRSRWSPYH